MEFETVIKNRKSVRIFDSTEVSKETLDKVLELAKLCPSAGAIRGYEVIVTKQRLISIEAPVYLVVCTDQERYSKKYGDRGHDLYSIQDATIFASYIQLLLVNVGLSSVWIGAFRERKIKEVLNTKLKPIAIIAVGYKDLFTLSSSLYERDSKSTKPTVGNL